MSVRETFEINSIATVLQELSPLIQDVQRTLEKGLDSGRPTAGMDNVVRRLGEIAGTLQLLDLHGPSVLVREMRALGEALAREDVGDTDSALDALLRSIFRLPDHLDRIHAGQRDAPLVLLPLINELRAARGESELEERALFLPDVAAHFPVDESATDSGELQAAARRLRPHFQKALLGWIRERHADACLNVLGRICRQLSDSADRAGVRRLWQACAALAESLAGVKSTDEPGARALLVRAERLLARLVREGEPALARSLPEDLLRDLLYRIAHSEAEGENLLAVRQAHKLDDLVAGERDAAAFEGPNRELLEAVGEGIREDLNRVKNAVEIFVHSEEPRPEALEGLPEQLHRVADTFSMLGLSALHDALAAEAGRLAGLDPAAEETQGRLQELADLLLRADNDLRALQSGRPVVDSAGIEVEDAEALAIRRLPDSEYYPLVSAVVASALDDLSRVREAIGAYCADPESGTEAVAEVPVLLSEVAGALAILPLEETLPIVRSLRGWIERELLGEQRHPDEQTQILIADVVAGVEYYLEAVDHDRIGMTHLLESAKRAVAALESGEAPERYEEDEEVVIESSDDLPDAGGAAQAGSGDATPEEESAPEPSDRGAASAEPAAGSGRADLDDSMGGSVSPAPVAGDDRHDAPAGDDAEARARADESAAPGGDAAAESPAPAAVAGADEGESDAQQSAGAAAPGVDPDASGSSQLAVLGDEVDEEIVEVFIEEALGELDKINENLPKWRAAPDDEGTLIIVRRAYHTLKGGGRLIGAELIGEFSWAMEHLLNRVIDHSIDPSAAVFDTLEEASAALPQLIEQLQGNRAPIEGIDDLIARAHALSRGEEPPPGGGGRRNDSTPPQTSPGGDAEPGDRSPGRHADAGSVTMDPDEPPSAPDDAADSPGAAESRAVPTVEADTAATPAVPEARADDESSHREELLRIFADEAESHCRLLRQHFDEPGGGTDLTVDEESRRVLHTLVGSAQTAAVDPVAEVAWLMQDMVRHRRDQSYHLPGEAAELFREAVVRLNAMIADMRAGREPDPGDLVSRLRRAGQQLRPAASEEADESGDSELLEVFLEEADEILETCDHAVGRWREEPNDRQALSELQRALHTLKGGARMSGLPAIADLTHETESLIEAVVEGSVDHDDEMLDLVQEAVDSLTVLLEHARNHQPLSPVDWLVEDLRSLRAGAGAAETETGSGEESSSAVADTEIHGAEAGEGADGERSPSAPEVERGSPGSTDRHGRQSHASDQIRVQAELLDNLVNFAGEVSIYHSRLGEQMTQYRFNLNEFQQTVNRVREQLRTMENETESQILYRHQKEADSPDEDWDPLEFDRYTRIQEMSRSLAESIGDLDSIKEILDNLTRDAETLLLQQSRVSSDLQNGLMQTRMVRFDGLRARLARVVRQTASTLHKRVQLTMTGGELEIDRSVQERIVAPLEHILRNAVSHGIESPARRREAGKPEHGTIRIDLHRGGSDIIIDITDDGAGIDPARVRRKGIEKGLIGADDDIDDNEVIKLILETGFSTADEVTQISGRGVGMDVVDAEIRRLGGTLGIQTGVGSGTRFSVRLPVTLAINQAVLVGAGDEQYAIPIASIEGVAQVTAGELKGYYVDRSRLYAYGGNEYKLRHLGSLLGVSEPRLEDEAISYPVIMIRAADERVALHVDQLLGRREVVVKPVGAPVNTLPAISGATIMADGTVVLILDMGGLLGTEHRFIATGIEDERAAAGAAGDEGAETGQEDAPMVLVVDDSITIRKVTQRILARNGIRVETAKDGVDAVAWMGENVPDLILLDIEMPRMDGYEVANYVRGEERLAKVPIIMITSRTGQKHRQRAEDAGVNRYLGKPYQETELMEHINELLSAAA